jgi:gliding motility-associated-like protein
MKKLFLLLLILVSVNSFANHLKGGFFTYTYLGPGNNNPANARYRITLTVYMDCAASGAQINNPINFTIYNGTSSTMFANSAASITDQYNLSKGKDDECITGNQAICFYKIIVYTLPEIELPPNPSGYTIAYQRCCRIAGILNIAGSSSSIGNTYSAFIPGSNLLATPNNNSPTFQVNDTVVICRNSFFQYSFLSTDPDGDSLSYSFCEAYVGGTQGDPAPPAASSPQTFSFVNYSNGFSGASPLGSGVTIDPRTGLISGVAPANPGEYVVTVCVNEYRANVLLNTHRKELHIKIGDCDEIEAVPAVFDIAGIRVEPNGASCKSFTYNFDNAVPVNPLITSYYWEFSDGATYNVKNPSHTFADTGRYTIKLVVNRGQDCSDSATTSIRIYPGFFTGFTHTGVCVNKTTTFTDTSSTRYGTVNSWRWDFGEQSLTNDTSRLRNPTFTYPTDGTKNVVFIVTNSMGCVDTVRKPIDILTRPPLSVAFKDTLICNGDSVQLQAIGQGVFSWTPATNIIAANTADPIVHPGGTTNYIVQLDDQGCLANDTVQVRVVDFVSLQAMADTVICAGDSLQLRATTNGLQYQWNNPATLNDPAVLNPKARPIDNPTVYTIRAFIGPRCFAEDNVVVSLTPYAVVNAGNDTTICFNTPASLNGFTDGTLTGWLPRNRLSNPNIVNPSATPLATTAYVLGATNNLGCITRDTVVVTVNPEVIAFAGRDTAIVVGQTLQFNATGGEGYVWSPGTGLSSTTVPDPKGNYDGSIDSIRYNLLVTDSVGCSDEATVLVKVFRTNPRVFVPTAFTPNGDGRNEVVAPIAVGLSKLDYFRIYNRWGQLVFQTTVNGKGWDGRIAGKEQGTSTYVWIVKGTDFTGKVVFEKGTVTLIR